MKKGGNQRKIILTKKEKKEYGIKYILCDGAVEFSESHVSISEAVTFRYSVK